MVETTENSLIVAKTTTPIHKGQFFGVFSNGGEINIDNKYGVRVSKLGNGNFFHIKILMYGEKPAYKINKFVKVKKVIKEVPVIKEKLVKEIKYVDKPKEDYEMKIDKEVSLFEDL